MSETPSHVFRRSLVFRHHFFVFEMLANSKFVTPVGTRSRLLLLCSPLHRMKKWNKQLHFIDNGTREEITITSFYRYYTTLSTA